MSVAAATRERWAMSVEARALVLVTATLVVFGLATLYSASAIVAIQDDRESWYFLARQAMGVMVGMALFAAAAKIDAEGLHRLAWPLMIVTVVLMTVIVLPFTQAIAPRINGSRRFLFGAALQPSELGKLAVVVWTSMLLVKKGDQMRRLTKGLLPFLVVIGVLDVLAILEPDLSVAMMYTLVMGIILFTGGVRVGHFVALGIIALPLLWSQLMKLQYALERILSFMHADASSPVVSYQLKQSLIAVGAGGLFGRGFGNGRQQYGFVPLGYNDFIGSTVGEEWGFVGMLFLVGVFALYGWLGMRIARQARTPFLQLVAVGLTVTMVITAFLHIGVVIGLLPTTGLTLPFVSYGRTNLLLSFVITGILVNIGSQKERVVAEHATNPLTAPA
ncbi:MAG TPA: putative peptidoglycan glycosyltransferase FtsW [Gemmatimonadaceae bacterium]|nr:putative peptidoglycan glycosyltransferase FtsW [Gemmatimonadaceae bacterium]